MNGNAGLLFQCFFGTALYLVGVWLLCVKLPAEWGRRSRMLVAVGVIQDGLQASSVLKKLTDAKWGTSAASLPMVAFKTNQGTDVITTIGVTRSGRGARHMVFEVGQEVLLKYVPADPKVVAVDGQPSRILFYGMFCAGMLFCGGFWAYAALRDLVAAQ